MISGSKPEIPNETFKSVTALGTCEKDFYFNKTTSTCVACSGAGLNSANCEFCGGAKDLNEST